MDKNFKFQISNFKLRIFESSNLNKGFTLIELILAMAIIGGLAAIFITTYPASQGKARDTQRKSDLKQYQTALEALASRGNGLYPIRNPAAVDPNTLCVTPLGYPSASSCPIDPRNGTSSCSGALCAYRYLSDATGATQYALWARLERPPDTTRPFFIICSTGKSADGATAPSAVNLCPI